MIKDDLTNVAVYFNNEYIGEAISFKFYKSNTKQMAMIDIKGDYQAKR